MASRKEQKAEAKRQRLAAQAAREAQEKKARVIRWSAAGLALVIIIVGALILTSQNNSGGGGGGQTVAGVAEANTLVGGIAQDNMTVGDSKAKVTIREFADLRCPVCKKFADTQYDKLFAQSIKPGKAKLQFENWAILGDESTTAAKAALAAGKQNKGFLFADIFYRNQKNEAVPYVTDEFLTSIAQATGLDIAQWNKDRQNPKYDKILDQINKDASDSGFTGTPSFIVVDAKGDETVIPSGATADVLIEAVKKAQ